MDDKSIRKILIEYLKSKYGEVRIYQEKSIGGAICDLMAVSDRLDGYEIKSDQDNYARIGSQVGWYDSFFNRNYIVVGRSHEKTVYERVPRHWGVIVVTEDNVYEASHAIKNPNLDMERQISLLWKMELSNLLSYFRLPAFSMKGKGFIAEKLIESVPHDQLSQRIAYELLHRDYSIFDAVDYTEYFHSESAVDGSTNEYINALVDNVSEMEQMTLDKWIQIFNQSQEIKKIKEEQIVKRAERPKHAITYEEIEALPGVPWISKEIITAFAHHLIMLGERNRPSWLRGVRVNYEPITGNWYIERKNDAKWNVSCATTYGLKRYNALYILEATLNLREIKLYCEDDKGKFDEDATMAALEKQKLIIDLFKKWIWELPV